MIQNNRMKLLYGLSILSLSGTLTARPVTAQIMGDGTLGTQVNGSIVAPCTGSCIITNGATRGNNLFHSFQRFSLPDRDIANFQIAPTIQNVIVRVTGIGQPFISNLNGTIQTSNPANFFLLNPNGILFGPGATLNIGGSFLATTADRMQFSDGNVFGTTNPTPLLSINVPIGLQFNNNPGSIQMQRSVLAAGQGDRFSDFVLVGGDIELDRSTLRTPGRRVSLGSVGENGFAQLQMQGDSRSGRLSLNLEADTSRRDIILTNRSAIGNASPDGGGGSVLMGRNITFNDSVIITGVLRGNNQNATNRRSEDIIVNATETLKLMKGSVFANEVVSAAIGQGGKITVTVGDLQVLDGSNIATRTGGIGNAGVVQVTANSILLDGASPDNKIGSSIGSIVVGNTVIGKGGDVIINTKALTLTNGGTISASAFGNGDAGNLQVTAQTIVLDSFTPNQAPGGIFSQVSPNVTGQGGNLSIQTDSLIVKNGASISASTFGKGNAGNISVKAKTIVLNGVTPNGGSSSGIFTSANTGSTGNSGEIKIEIGSLLLMNGAAISAKTFSRGDAGNVTIRANTIDLDGTTPDGQFATSISSEASRNSNGNGRTVTLITDSLRVSNQATISASAFGQGNAGNLNITARNIKLDRGAGINAFARSGNGADIKLTIGDRLEMRRGSQISTSAGLAGVGGNGGNMTIDARNAFLVTAPNENNDITANAFNGSGGRVTIDTQGIYGFTVRSREQLAALLNTNDPNKLDPSLLPSNDITAISQGNPTLNGSVNVNVLNLDPSRGLLVLPIDRIDPSQQIAQACQPSGKQSRGSFVMVGQGGMPPNPIGVLSGETLIARLAGESIGSPVIGLSTESPRITSNSVIEINSWIVEPNGTVKLVAIVPGVESRGFAPVGCL